MAEEQSSHDRVTEAESEESAQSANGVFKSKSVYIALALGFLLVGTAIVLVYVEKLQNAPIEAREYDFNYSTDGSVVYHRQYRVEGANPRSFEVLGDWYAKDNAGVYYQGGKLQDADPKTFVFVGDFHAKDKDVVYHRDDVLEGVDPESFEVIDKYRAKDKGNVYYETKILANADPASFTTLSDAYAKDIDSVFYYDKEISGADTDTFEVLYFGYSKDSRSVYYNAVKMEEADPTTFEVLGNSYPKGQYSLAKDSGYVYKAGVQLAGADPATFQTLDETSSYAKDKNSVYVFIKFEQILGKDSEELSLGNGVYLFEGVDVDTFELLGSGFMKDKDYIYVADKRSVPDGDGVKIVPGIYIFEGELPEPLFDSMYQG